jgi:hypothetical protein
MTALTLLRGKITSYFATQYAFSVITVFICNDSANIVCFYKVPVRFIGSGIGGIFLYGNFIA